jgi:hypothetical protein
LAEWPKEVRRLVGYLRETGFNPEVTGTPGGAWEVAVEGEHVRATANFAFRGGRTQYDHGTMAIDGKSAPLAKDHADLRRIWDEHETTARAVPYPAVEPEPAALLEITDPGRQPVPYAVRAAVVSLENQLAAAGLEGTGSGVRTGVSGAHWAVGIDLPGGDGLRIIFTRYRRAWDPDRDQPVQVIVGGENRTAEAEGDVGKAMALLARSLPPQPADAPPGASAVRQQASHRDLGVETRRQVVIRELRRQAWARPGRSAGTPGRSRSAGSTGRCGSARTARCASSWSSWPRSSSAAVGCAVRFWSLTRTSWASWCVTATGT